MKGKKRKGRKRNTATQVACGRAGAVIKKADQAFEQKLDCKDHLKMPKHEKCDGPTIHPTDTAGCSFACTRLKIGEKGGSMIIPTTYVP